MRGIGPLNLLIGVSLAFVIGTSTDSYTQTTALRGARVMNEATRGTHSSYSASSIPRFPRSTLSTELAASRLPDESPDVFIDCRHSRLSAGNER